MSNLPFFGPCGTESKRSEAMTNARSEAQRLTKDTGREHVYSWDKQRNGYQVELGRADISAPYQARFTPDGPNEMFAHTLAEMLAHCARIIQTQDKRFRGFIRITNQRGDLVFAEINVLGWLPEQSPTQRFSERLASGALRP